MARTQLSVLVAPMAWERPRVRTWLMAANACGIATDVSTIVVDYCGVQCCPVVSRPRGVGPEIIVARARVDQLFLGASPTVDYNGWLGRLWSGVAPTVGRVTLCNGYPLRVAACLDFNYSTGPDGSPAGVFRRMVRLTSFELVAPIRPRPDQHEHERDGQQAVVVLCQSGQVIEEPGPSPVLGYFSTANGGVQIVTEAPLPVVWDVDRNTLAKVIASSPGPVPPLEVECQLTYHVPARFWPQNSELCVCVSPNKTSDWAVFGCDGPRGFEQQGLWSALSTADNVNQPVAATAVPVPPPRRRRRRRCLCLF